MTSLTDPDTPSLTDPRDFSSWNDIEPVEEIEEDDG